MMRLTYRKKATLPYRPALAGRSVCTRERASRSRCEKMKSSSVRSRPFWMSGVRCIATLRARLSIGRLARTATEEMIAREVAGEDKG